MTAQKPPAHFRVRFLLVSGLLHAGLFFHYLHQKIASALGTAILILSKPEDLEELTKRFYNRLDSLEVWGGAEVTTLGLTEEESHFVTTYLEGKKSCLVLMCGGGREVFPISKLGFEVTGVDSAPALVEKARQRASALSLRCAFEVGDLLNGAPPAGRYDALLLTQAMYSTIPGRKRRVDFLKRMRTLLNDTGFFYLEFSKKQNRRDGGWKFRFKRSLAILCDGNRELKEGDSYWIRGTFLHHFEPSELLSEIEEGCFKVVENAFDRRYVILTPSKT